MARKNTFGKNPTLFSPSVVRALTGGRSTIEGVTSAALSGSMTSVTGSFRHDPPGSPLKSTQQLPIDWSDFTNHTFFNSAEGKVNVAFERIVNNYPFDGSRGEAVDFMDSLTGFEDWVFGKFPKHLGFLHFGGYDDTGTNLHTHISVKDIAGGYIPSLSRDKSGDTAIDPGTKSIGFEFHLHIPSGTTYTHAGATRTLPSGNQVICQKLNEAGTNGIGVYLESTAITEPSGSLVVIISSGTLAASASMKIQKGGWNHICAQYNKVPGISQLQLYRNAKYVDASDTIEMGDFGFSETAFTIGSGSNHYYSASDGSTLSSTFTNSLSGALDDFRVWHSPRNVKGLERERWINISPRKSLKLYFKFNEPTGSYTSNNLVLDYSGKSLHTSIIQGSDASPRSIFHSSSRETRTLVNPVLLEMEEDNPVLFPTYIPLLDLNNDLLNSGALYDANNPNQITKLVPKHYLDEAAVFEGFGQEKELGGTGDPYGFKHDFPGGGKMGAPQIMASMLFIWAKYFDELKMFLDQFGKLMSVDRVPEGSIADTFLPFFAQYYGFNLPEMFPEASLDQFIGKRGHTVTPKVAGNSLQQIQNVIWRRILSDTSELIKSKGTIHGLKVFMRNMGINPDRTFRFREFGGSPTRNITDVRDAYTEMNSVLDFSGSYAKTTVSKDFTGKDAYKPFIQSPFLLADRDEPGIPNPIGNRTVRFHKIYASGGLGPEQHAGYSVGSDENSDLQHHWRPHKLKMDSVYTTSSIGDDIDATYHFDESDGRRYLVQSGPQKGQYVKLAAARTQPAILSDSTPFTKYVGDTHGKMKSVILNGDLTKNTTEWISSSFHMAMSDGSTDVPFSVGGWFKLLETGSNQGLFQLGSGSFQNLDADYAPTGSVDEVANLSAVSSLSVRLYVTSSNAATEITGSKASVTLTFATGTQNDQMRIRDYRGNHVDFRASTGSIHGQYHDNRVGGFFINVAIGASPTPESTAKGWYERISNGIAATALDMTLSATASNATSFTITQGPSAGTTGMAGSGNTRILISNTTTITASHPSSVADPSESPTPATGQDISYHTFLTSSALIDDFGAVDTSGNSATHKITGSYFRGGRRNKKTADNGLAFEVFNGATHAAYLRCSVKEIPLWSGQNNMLSGDIGKWHHVMATYAGNKASSGLKLYLNGQLLSTTNAAVGSYSAGTTGSLDKGVRLGSVYGDADSALSRAYLTGALSDWAFWKRELNAHESRLVNNAAPEGNVYPSRFKEKPFRPARQDGLLTSGSWSYEAFYRFPPKGELGVDQFVTQSLVRLNTTGSKGPREAIAPFSGSVAHRLYGNLIAFSGSLDLQTTGSLTLFMRPQVNGPILQLPLTGADVFDGDKWHVSFGRVRNDLTGSILSSSYFLRAGKVKNGKLFEYHTNKKWFGDHMADAARGVNVCESLTGSFNASGSFFTIGSQGLSYASGTAYGNDMYATGALNHWSVATQMNNETFFGGRVARIRFWSKGLTERETREHALNYRSLGVIDPKKNFNFNTRTSGSFERLRLDVTMDQPITKSVAPNGSIKLFDFSQNNFHLSGSGFASGVEEIVVIKPETFDFAMLSPNFDQAKTSNKVRVRSFKSRKNIDLHSGKFAPLYNLPPNEQPRDDTRFSVEISVVQALNEDIVNIFGTFDALDNIIGAPELQFSQDYPDMAALRDVYFNRLTSKLNIPKFFEFFRWFDGTIGNMIEHMLPRKTKFLGVNFVIESHMLERAKYNYNTQDMYIGPNDRHGLKGQILLQQFVVDLKRY